MQAVNVKQACPGWDGSFIYNCMTKGLTLSLAAMHVELACLRW